MFNEVKIGNYYKTKEGKRVKLLAKGQKYFIYETDDGVIFPYDRATTFMIGGNSTRDIVAVWSDSPEVITLEAVMKKQQEEENKVKDEFDLIMKNNKEKEEKRKLQRLEENNKVAKSYNLTPKKK